MLYIGQAGARSPFGLRSELQRELAERGAGCQFRVEVNQQYRSRWFELLMVHQADHGSLPPDNAKNPPPISAARASDRHASQSPLLHAPLPRERRGAPQEEEYEEHAWISSPAPNSRC